MTKASGKSTKDVYQASSTFTGLWMPPETLTIVGLDVPDSFAPELADPDRIDQASESLIRSVTEHGVKEDIVVARVTGKVKGQEQTLSCVVDGRQRVMAAREANKRLKAKGSDATISVPCRPEKTGDLFTTAVVTNEHRREDSVIAKAKKAERLRSYGKSDKDICTAFGIQSQTLGNWFALLALDPKLVNQVEAGKVPVAVGYQLGRLPKEEQQPALEKLIAEAPEGKLTGATGRESARIARQARDTESKGGEARQVSAKLSAGQVKALWEEFGPTDTQPPFEDDASELVFRLLEVILGKDATGRGLKDWPTIQKGVRKIIKSAKADD